MSDKEFPSCAYDVCAEFDCEETMALALIATRNELDRTRKALEQSEICCTEWEKQAIDYKAENIALSGELECTRKALDVAVDAIKNATEYLGNQEPLVDVMAMNLYTDLSKALEQITALEQKD